MDERDAQPGTKWQRWEIAALVAAYFDLLEAEVRGERRVKSDANRQLRELLTSRTRGSIEYKLQNVSAILDEEHLPFIDGYKPARNYQQELRHAVLAWVSRNHAVAEELAAYGSAIPVETRRPCRLADVVVPAPSAAGRQSTPRRLRLSQGEWGALRDMRLRDLGAAGEEWVTRIERAELQAVGRQDLADRVEWTAKERGDGFGFDVSSFESDGTPVQIEVKTTNLGAGAPFYVTRNEVRTSAELAATYRLYRVFEFSREPRVFVVPGAVESGFSLAPLVYSASVRGGLGPNAVARR